MLEQVSAFLILKPIKLQTSLFLNQLSSKLNILTRHAEAAKVPDFDYFQDEPAIIAKLF